MAKKRKKTKTTSATKTTGKKTTKKKTKKKGLKKFGVTGEKPAELHRAHRNQD